MVIVADNVEIVHEGIELLLSGKKVSWIAECPQVCSLGIL
jgi:hypothetical protein